MRTTIDLPGDLLDLAKQRAAEAGTTLSAAVAAALRQAWMPAAADAPPFLLVTAGAAGAPAPGWEAIRRLDAAEDAARYGDLPAAPRAAEPGRPYGG